MSATGASREEILERVRRRILETAPHLPPEALEEDAPLLENGALDSITLVETALFLEAEFRVKVSAGDLSSARFGTLAAIAEFVTSRLRGDA